MEETNVGKLVFDPLTGIPMMQEEPEVDEDNEDEVVEAPVEEEKKEEVFEDELIGIDTKYTVKTKRFKSGKLCKVREITGLDEIESSRFVPGHVKKSKDKETQNYYQMAALSLMSIMSFDGKDQNYWYPKDPNDVMHKLSQIKKNDLNELMAFYLYVNEGVDESFFQKKPGS